VPLRPAELLRDGPGLGRLAVDGSPPVVTTGFGPVVEFDGVDDRLVLAIDPLHDADGFTIEMLFLLLNVFPRSAEPRVLHLESPGNPDRRVTMELRLNDLHWFAGRIARRMEYEDSYGYRGCSNGSDHVAVTGPGGGCAGGPRAAAPVASPAETLPRHHGSGICGQ
jgi:hypothetical protein